MLMWWCHCSWLDVSPLKKFSLVWFLCCHNTCLPFGIHQILSCFCSSKYKTPGGVRQGFYRRKRHILRCRYRQPAGIPYSTSDDPARPTSHAGSQTGYATSAASSWNAKSSSTSIPLTSKHAPANDAWRTHVSTRQIQDADALPSSWPSFPSTSFHGTRGHGWQGRDAFPKREARVWVSTLPQRKVVEVSWLMDLRGDTDKPLWDTNQYQDIWFNKDCCEQQGCRNFCSDFFYTTRTFS